MPRKNYAERVCSGRPETLCCIIMLIIILIRSLKIRFSLKCDERELTESQQLSFFVLKIIRFVIFDIYLQHIVP